MGFTASIETKHYLQTLPYAEPTAYDDESVMRLRGNPTSTETLFNAVKSPYFPYGSVRLIVTTPEGQQYLIQSNHESGTVVRWLTEGNEPKSVVFSETPPNKLLDIQFGDQWIIPDYNHGEHLRINEVSEVYVPLPRAFRWEGETGILKTGEKSPFTRLESELNRAERSYKRTPTQQPPRALQPVIQF